MWNMGVPLQHGLSDGSSSQQCNQKFSKPFANFGEYSSSYPRSNDLTPSTPNHVLSTTPSIFYMADRYVGFSQFDCQTTSSAHPLFTTLCPSETSLSVVNHGLPFSGNPAKKNDFCPDDIPYESVTKLSSQENMNSRVVENFARPLFRNSLETELWPSSPRNLAGAHFVIDARSIETSKALPHSNIGCHSPYTSVQQPSHVNLQAKRGGLTKASSAGVHVTSKSAAPSVPSKTRIRWNPELHQQFVDSVSRLGGAEKATPKGVLKLMGIPGLTIYHVKSHLQKYRIAKHLPDSAEVKFGMRASANLEPHLDLKTSTQISEALRLQLDVQRQLHEQLEAQRAMQLRIEEQGKQLMKMFEEQQRVNLDIIEAQSSEATPEDTHPTHLGLEENEGSECKLFPQKLLDLS